jgi:YVTN family beta-propeller protein
MRRMFPALLFCLLLLSIGRSQSPEQGRKLPGPGAEGYLLPNGWSLTPAGSQIQVGDLPLSIALHPDGQHLLVANNGYGEQSIDVIDIPGGRVVSRVPVEKSWLGLAIAAGGKEVFAGGGAGNNILKFSFNRGELKPLPPIPLGTREDDIFAAGISVSGRRLYVANNLQNSVSAINLDTGKITGTVEVGIQPYSCIASPDGTMVYTSVWGAAQVAAIDVRSWKVRDRIPTDDHPNALLFSHDGKRLFVANANANTISVIDVAAAKAIERVSVALYPDSPAGSTTNALALSPAGDRLYAANADNNDVAVIDVREPGKSKVLGFIPVGWYPTALAVSRDGRSLFVANGKGTRSAANPAGPQPTVRRTPKTELISGLFLGSVSAIPVPDAAALARYTAQVYKNVPYNEKLRFVVPFEGKSAVPAKVGDTSPIQHVIYIVKENRTYDQVLGDMKEGNGDPKLTLFGEEVTPNHHALARDFVLLDNFYCDAEVSADGHNWSVGAYATDYVEKMWPSQYSNRRKTYDFEGGSPIVAPSAGYIWDACSRAGVSYRSYGEFVVSGRKVGESAIAAPEGPTGHVDPGYRGFDPNYSDLDRAKRFLSELRRFEKEGDMPRFQVVRLPNDHTQATRAGSLTPISYVAQNDLALGMLVEGVSQSKFWPTTAIFVIEDDAQNGPDHVDAHRTVALAISPFIRRKTVDSTMYSTSSMVRTMELILGLAPMSQYDAAATPMFAAFAETADVTPYKALPARVSLTAVNRPDAPGAKRSQEMDFSQADRAPDIELNEILWKSIRGKDAVMPAPVRAAFVRPIDKEKEDR